VAVKKDIMAASGAGENAKSGAAAKRGGIGEGV